MNVAYWIVRAWLAQGRTIRSFDGRPSTPTQLPDKTPFTIARDRAGSLDAAWAEVEAALPEGWDLSVMSLRSHVDPKLDGPEPYAATASAPRTADYPYTRVVSSEQGRERGSSHDATPAAPLDGLDVERLGRAMVEHRTKLWATEPCVAECARDIAREYAALRDEGETE